MVSKEALALLRLLHEMEDDDVDAVMSSEALSEQTGQDPDEVQEILNPYLTLYVEVVSTYSLLVEGEPLRCATD